MPESFEYAKNGGRRYLFHNLGNGRFEEVSAKLGIDSRRWGIAAGQRIFAAPGRPGSVRGQRLWNLRALLQRRDAVREVGGETGVGFAPKSGMNVAFGDFLNQGRYAVYVSTSPKTAFSFRATICGCRRKERPVRT
jgi:hypothetical protein